MTLDAKQLLLIEMLADPRDERTKEEKCVDAGYSEKWIYQLQKNPEFLAKLHERTTVLVAACRAEIYADLRRNSRKGDAMSAKTFLMGCGDIQGGVSVTTNVTQTTNGEFREAVRKAQEARAGRFQRASRLASCDDE